jgi:hypothetical protein
VFAHLFTFDVAFLFARISGATALDVLLAQGRVRGEVNEETFHIAQTNDGLGRTWSILGAALRSIVQADWALDNFAFVVDRSVITIQIKLIPP